MTPISRRGLLHIGAGTAAALGISSLTGEFASAGTMAQRVSNAAGPAEPTVQVDTGAQIFYRDDYFGPPWSKPDPVLMIHGVGESGITWYGWVPRMAQRFRLLRPDLPGFGQSAASNSFEWTLPSLAKTFSQFMDAMQVESAHIIGAKVGGAIAMQFAADFPSRTRTLVVASGPVSEPKFNNTTAKVLEPKWVQDTQRDRLGSGASQEQVDYWIKMMNETKPETTRGINKVTTSLNLEPVLPRITAPTLVITADRSSLQSVETVLRYQQKIPKSRLLVLPSDAYHVAVAKADECVTSVLTFIEETKA